MDAYEIITAALTGDLDDNLDGIIAACIERRSTRSRSLFYILKIGDKVRYTTGRPLYLQGAVGTVVGKKQSKLVIDLDERRQKFFKGIVTPPGLLEKI